MLIKTFYFFDEQGNKIDQVKYVTKDIFTACRAAADYADEIGATDYDSELPEQDEEVAA